MQNTYEGMQQNLLLAGFVWCGGVAHADGEGVSRR